MGIAVGGTGIAMGRIAIGRIKAIGRITDDRELLLGRAEDRKYLGKWIFLSEDSTVLSFETKIYQF